MTREDIIAPEALRLADILMADAYWSPMLGEKAAAELRHLHEEVTEQGRLLSMSAERELALLARIDRLEKLNAELLKALQSVTLVCDNVHHAKKDRHGFAEPCPVTERIRVAIAKAGEQA